LGDALASAAMDEDGAVPALPQAATSSTVIAARNA
jgi:hypothetical protein